MDIDRLAQSFSQFYYTTFSTNRSDLVNVYRPHSLLTFESAQFAGAEAIIGKLTVAHRVSTLDAQPNGFGNGAIVMVTGELLIDEETNPQRFSQVFHLVKDGDAFFVINDIFRLNYS